MWPRWIRAAATVWVAWDSRKRKTLDWFWVLTIFLLGPLLLPFYMVKRPLLGNEKRKGGLFWNLFLSCEKLLSWITGLAATAVFLENFTLPKNKDLAEIRRAEIKAGSLMGLILFIVAAGFEKASFEVFKNRIERKFPE